MRTNSLIVAGFQMRFRKNPFQTAHAIVKAMRRASKRNAICLLTPEMILTGYHTQFKQKDRDKTIRDILAPACKRLEMTLFLGTGNWISSSGRRLPKPLMEILILGPSGKKVGVYHKIILTKGDLDHFSPGHPKEMKVRKLGGISYGLTICNDFWATPLFTTLPDRNLPLLWARKGAKLLFHSVASGQDSRYLDFHTRRMQDSAVRNQLWVVSANAALDSGHPVNAPSGILGPNGLWKTKVPLTGENLFTGQIPF
jgi:predicted amidohydrolase